jgi:2'-5' RNA ligase
MPRLFTGLEIPENIAAELALLKGGVHGARWIDAGDYHITLRFIGDIDDATALEVEEALGHVHGRALSLRLSGLDWFGGKKPHSIFAKVAPDEALSHLQASIEQACQSAGLEPERRKFTPHVTIARCRGARLSEVRDYVSRHGLFSAGPFDVRRFTLFSARPSRGGGPYIAERRWELEDAG